MIWQTVFYWTGIVAIIVTALTVYYSNRRPVFANYALFSLSLAAWLGCQYFVDNDIAVRVMLGLGLITVALAAGFFVLFAYSFPDGSNMPLKYRVLPFLLLILLGGFSFSSFLVEVSPNGEFEYGWLYYLQTFLLIVTVLIAMIILVVNYFRYKREESNQQLKLLLVAFIPFLVASYLTGVTFANNPNWQILRPLSALIMILVIDYTIVRHRLFDIRAVIARSVGYATSVLVISAIYGFIVFGLANLFFDISIPLKAQIALSLATGFASLSFQYLRELFDFLTKRLFYRDAYDAQELFNSLNKVFVSSLEVKYIATQSSQIISDTFRPTFCAIGLRQDSNSSRVFGTESFESDDASIEKIQKLSSHLNLSVVARNRLDDDMTELRTLMRGMEVEVLAGLNQKTHNKAKNELGYIILGPKKSGSPYSQTDIRTLESVANNIVIAIQNALRFEETQHFNVVLQEKVEEATRKLRTTNSKLRALDETKDDFISMASHQLRTPLTSVKGYLSMVLEGDAGKLTGTQKKMLGQAFVSSQRMVYLIADLLNVSRLKTGKFVIEPSQVDLSKMIEEELSQLTETAAAHEITLTYHKPENFPVLDLDETKTRQVIMNFIDNAIYYTLPGGRIDVVLEETPTSVELKVVDDGIGVPKAEQHHLFTKFYRAGNARKARPDGTGLGLFMAKKVVLAQGGSIIFESKEGKGSTFGFLFPKKPVVAAKPLPVAKKAAAAK